MLPGNIRQSTSKTSAKDKAMTYLCGNLCKLKCYPEVQEENMTKCVRSNKFPKRNCFVSSVLIKKVMPYYKRGSGSRRSVGEHSCLVVMISKFF